MYRSGLFWFGREEMDCVAALCFESGLLVHVVCLGQIVLICFPGGSSCCVNDGEIIRPVTYFV